MPRCSKTVGIVSSMVCVQGVRVGDKGKADVPDDIMAFADVPVQVLMVTPTSEVDAKHGPGYICIERVSRSSAAPRESLEFCQTVERFH